MKEKSKHDSWYEFICEICAFCVCFFLFLSLHICSLFCRHLCDNSAVRSRIDFRLTCCSESGNNLIRLLFCFAVKCRINYSWIPMMTFDRRTPSSNIAGSRAVNCVYYSVVCKVHGAAIDAAIHSQWPSKFICRRDSRWNRIVCRRVRIASKRLWINLRLQKYRHVRVTVKNIWMNILVKFGSQSKWRRWIGESLLLYISTSIWFIFCVPLKSMIAISLTLHYGQGSDGCCCRDAMWHFRFNEQ